MPAATPQTAIRRSVSQSPPSRPGRFVHRRPVTTMQTAIASSSISPYMWMSSGPSSKKPLEVGRTAVVEQRDGLMQIDIVTRRKPLGSARRVAGPLELLGAPALDPVELCGFENVEFGLAHSAMPPVVAVMPTSSARANALFSPVWGERHYLW